MAKKTKQSLTSNEGHVACSRRDNFVARDSVIWPADVEQAPINLQLIIIHGWLLLHFHFH